MRITKESDPLVFERHDRITSEDLANGFEINDADYHRFRDEIERTGRHLSPQERHAWAVYSAHEHAPKASHPAPSVVSGDASPRSGVDRVARSVETQSKEFRDLRVAFEQHRNTVETNGKVVCEALAKHEASTKESLDGAVQAIAEQGKANCDGLTALGLTVTGTADSMRVCIAEFQEWFASTWQKSIDDEMSTTRQIQREHAIHQRWMWAWRIAVLLALLLLASGIKLHAQTTTYIRGVNHGTTIAANATVTTNCLANNNCLDVDLLNVPHVICDSGCGGAASFSDNSAFTVGTTPINVIGAYYTSGAAPTLSSGNAARLRMDSNSYLFVDCVTGCAGGATTPTDAFPTPTTSGLSASFLMGYNGSSWDLLRTGDKNNVAAVVGLLNTGPLGRYNSTQPTLTDTRYNMLQVSSRGELLVSPGTSGFAISFTAPQHVILDSGTTVVTQGTGTNLHTVVDSGAVNATLQTSTGTDIGNVGLKAAQTLATLTTITNAVPTNADTTQGGTTAPTKSFTVGGKTNDGTAQYQDLPLGTGGRTVIVEGFAGGTAVPVSGSVTAACSTACEVSPTTAANTVSNPFFNQISNGTTNVTQDSTTTTATHGLDVNIRSILNTAPTAAGKLDVKGADGDVFVRQTTGTNLHVVTDATSVLAANQSVNISQVNAHTLIEAGVNGSQAVGGCVATNTATPCNPMNLGAQAVTSENTAATTAREVQLVADKVGKLITLPYANPENFVSGVTAAITDTTSTSLIASAGGSLKTYITSWSCTNSHATQGTFIKLLDNATIKAEMYAAPLGGGFAVTMPTPLVGTAATAWNVQAVTTGTNFICNAVGYTGL